MEYPLLFQWQNKNQKCTRLKLEHSTAIAADVLNNAKSVATHRTMGKLRSRVIKLWCIFQDVFFFFLAVCMLKLSLTGSVWSREISNFQRTMKRHEIEIFIKLIKMNWLCVVMFTHTRANATWFFPILSSRTMAIDFVMIIRLAVSRMRETAAGMKVLVAYFVFYWIYIYKLDNLIIDWLSGERPVFSQFQRNCWAKNIFLKNIWKNIKSAFIFRRTRNGFMLE